jgi:hypothetical protein
MMTWQASSAKRPLGGFCECTSDLASSAMSKQSSSIRQALDYGTANLDIIPRSPRASFDLGSLGLDIIPRSPRARRENRGVPRSSRASFDLGSRCGPRDSCAPFDLGSLGRSSRASFDLGSRSVGFGLDSMTKGGQSESLVPPYTRGSVALVDSTTDESPPVFKVGRCRLIVSTSQLKARLVSALETKM